jgi:hypothetical protein
MARPLRARRCQAAGGAANRLRITSDSLSGRRQPNLRDESLSLETTPNGSKPALLGESRLPIVKCSTKWHWNRSQAGGTIPSSRNDAAITMIEIHDVNDDENRKPGRTHRGLFLASWLRQNRYRAWRLLGPVPNTALQRRDRRPQPVPIHPPATRRIHSEPDTPLSPAPSVSL